MSGLAIFIPQILGGLAVSAATAAISYLLTPPPSDQEGPRLDDLSVTTSSYGKMRTISYGRISNAGNIIDSSNYYETIHETEEGGKGGKTFTVTTYTYSVDFALGLGEEIAAVEQIYANEQLIYDANGSIVKPNWLEFKIYLGTETQLPDPTLQSLHGVENTPAYRGEAYIVFTRFQLADFSNRIPSMRVVTYTSAITESIEYSINCNPDFSTVDDAILEKVFVNPKTKNIFHYWDWETKAKGRINPIVTVVNKHTNSVIFNLNKPSASPAADVRGFYFGGDEISNYNKAIYVFADYDYASSSLYCEVHSADTGMHEYSATLLYANAANTSTPIGSIFKDSIVLYSMYHVNLFNPFILAYVVESGEITNDSSSFIPFDNWKLGSPFNMSHNYQGEILINGENTVTGDKVLVKFTHGQGVSWYITMPGSIDTNPHLVARFAKYDEVNDIWWTAVGGIIWGFNNSDGSSIGVYDVTADPDYEVMSHEPCFNEITQKLYWVYTASGPATVIVCTWDTDDKSTLDQYLVDEIPTVLNSHICTYFDHVTNYLYYSNLGTAIEDPSRRIRLDLLVNSEVILSAVLANICQRCGLESNQYNVTDTSSIIVDGYRLTKLTTGRSNIAPLQHTYLFDVVDSGGILKFIVRGKDSIATIEEDDLGATIDINNPGPFIGISRIMETQLPSRGNVIYLNQDANHEPGLQPSRRMSSYNSNIMKLELPIVLTDDKAKQLIDIILHLVHIERESYKLKLMPKWQHLEGADIIDIETPDTTFHARIIKTSFNDGIVEVDAVREEKSIYTSYQEGGTVPSKNDVVAYPGVMIFALLDIPLLRNEDDNAGFYAAATSYIEDWNGGVLFKSSDDITWNSSSTFVSASIYGMALDILPESTNSWYWDNENILTVQLITGDLSSITKLQTLQGYNLAAYGRNGKWEIISFQTVSEIDTNIFEISDIIRGRMGTDANTSDHAENDIFIPLKTTNLQYVGNELADLNISRLYRGSSFGVNLYDEENITQALTNSGICLTPLSPQHIRGVRDGSLNLTLTWMPRSRYPSGNFWSCVQSETDDLYDIEIFKTGESIPIKTITDNDGPSYIWGRADQITLLGSGTESLTIDIYHKSLRIGRGYKGTGSAIAG